MRLLLRTLAVLAALCLVTQTVRHAYLLWFEPRTSVLDKYDRPLRSEIEAAESLDALLSKYDGVRKEVDRVKADRLAANPDAHFDGQQDAEPFKSESALREAISSWEERAKEVRAVNFYWTIGLVLAVLGLVSFLTFNEWTGVTLMLNGFSEIVYWTSPTFLAPTREFDRLLVHKLVLSVVSVAALVVAIRLLGIFAAEKRAGS